MKTRKKMITVVILWMAALILCFPGVVFSGYSANPGGQPECDDNYWNEPCIGEKAIGPVTKGVLIAGWKDGNITAFLYLDGELYRIKTTLGVNENDFLYSTPPTSTTPEVTVEEKIITWPFPYQIAEDFGFAAPPARAAVLEAKDVTNLKTHANIADEMEVPIGDYTHMLSCDVKISFIVPTSN